MTLKDFITLLTVFPFLWNYKLSEVYNDYYFLLLVQRLKQLRSKNK